jgi:hypothetical protein
LEKCRSYRFKGKVRCKKPRPPTCPMMGRVLPEQFTQLRKKTWWYGRREETRKVPRESELRLSIGRKF